MATQAGTGSPVDGTSAKPPRRRAGRPAFGVVAAVVVVYRLGREAIDRFVTSHFGFLGVVVVVVVGWGVIAGWRYVQRRRVRARGDIEFTPEMVRQQLIDSGLGDPAFAGDGSLLGSSVVVVNQRPKVLEIYTEYELFGADGAPLGSVRQLKQSRSKEIVRTLTPFDQFLTHHFDVAGPDGQVVLRLTRPRKIFRSRIHAFTGDDRFLGTLAQRNMFWKIRFDITGPDGSRVGELRAENLRAWDFKVFDGDGQQVATILKSWEGWAHTAFTRADRYVVRVERPLTEPLRSLTMAAALTVDLALKQDARGFG